MAAAKPTEREIAETYEKAIGYAKRRAPEPDELTEVAINAATDGVMWALNNYNAEAGSKFESFALSAVRRFVFRFIRQSAMKFHNRPALLEFNPSLEPGTGADSHETDHMGLPLSVRELPDDLRAVVRFFYVDRFDFRDIGLLMNCSMETARGKLRKAGEILGGGDMPKRSRLTGARRLKR